MTVLKLIPKLCDNNVYPTSLELLRVHLAATIFSEDVQDLLDQYKDDVSRELNIPDLDPLETYLQMFWELLQLNNSVSVIYFIYDYLFYYLFPFHRLDP